MTNKLIALNNFIKLNDYFFNSFIKQELILFLENKFENDVSDIIIEYNNKLKNNDAKHKCYLYKEHFILDVFLNLSDLIDPFDYLYFSNPDLKLISLWLDFKKSIENLDQKTKYLVQNNIYDLESYLKPFLIINNDKENTLLEYDPNYFCIHNFKYNFQNKNKYNLTTSIDLYSPTHLFKQVEIGLNS